ncbi:MAG TPA: hypothetical protein VHC90_26005 [Bryobacteraceae bacterium]|nr:hypothetical protein [Bryobacteraceae bacterium]
MTVIDAPATTLAEGSVTIPRSEPLDDCASAEITQSAKAQKYLIVEFMQD